MAVENSCNDSTGPKDFTVYVELVTFFMQGWTQNSRMKPLPVKAIEGPDTVRALHFYDSLYLQMYTCLY